MTTRALRFFLRAEKGLGAGIILSVAWNDEGRSVKECRAVPQRNQITVGLLRVVNCRHSRREHHVSCNESASS